MRENRCVMYHLLVFKMIQPLFELAPPQTYKYANITLHDFYSKFLNGSMSTELWMNILSKVNEGGRLQ